MFLLNSCLSLFSAAHSRGHPFSRSYGVILPSSLTILLPPALGFSPHPPVSVYGTGTYKAIADFLGTGLTCFATFISLRVTLSAHAADLPAAHLLRLHRYFHSRPMLSPCVPTVLFICGTGISACCPSDTSFDLSLGPDLPRADQLYSGNLGYSAERIPTSLSLLIPAFSLLSSPHPLTVMLRSPKNAPLPTLTGSAASVWCFSPGHFRRRTSRLVSCYALFECVAASEPTS